MGNSHPGVSRFSQTATWRRNLWGCKGATLLKKLARKCCKLLSYELLSVLRILDFVLLESFGGCSAMLAAEATGLIPVVRVKCWRWYYYVVCTL